MPGRSGVNIGRYIPVTYEDGSTGPTYDEVMSRILSRPPLSGYPDPVIAVIAQLAAAAGQRSQSPAPASASPVPIFTGLGARYVPNVAGLGPQNLPGLFGGGSPQPTPTPVATPVHPFFRDTRVSRLVQPVIESAHRTRGR